MLPPDDIRLLEDCLTGKAGAWEAFVGHFTPILETTCRHALRRCGRPWGSQEASDILQSVFLDLVENDMRVLRGYRGRGSLEGYLSTVAIRKVLRDRLLNPRGIPLPPAPFEPGDSGPSPSEALEGDEARRLLREGLDKLPPRAKLALILQSEGKSLREIGLAMGLSYEAAGQMVSRARSELRDSLTPKNGKILSRREDTLAHDP